MCRFLETIGILSFAVLVSVFVAFLAFLLLWMLPHAIVADARCLEKGFPKSSVAYTGKMYCMNLDGTIRVIVEEAK